jgi:hypothetical protein
VKKLEPQSPEHRQRLNQVWEALHFLLGFPEDPRQQLLGLRPRPNFQYLVPRPLAPVGSEWLDLRAWWDLALSRQERPMLPPPAPELGLDEL